MNDLFKTLGEAFNPKPAGLKIVELTVKKWTNKDKYPCPECQKKLTKEDNYTCTDCFIKIKPIMNF